ncbi:hypothetical protein D3C76_728860 [compost metagenome]
MSFNSRSATACVALLSLLKRSTNLSSGSFRSPSFFSSESVLSRSSRKLAAAVPASRASPIGPPMAARSPPVAARVRLPWAIARASVEAFSAACFGISSLCTSESLFSPAVAATEASACCSCACAKMRWASAARRADWAPCNSARYCSSEALSAMPALAT